MNKIYGNRFVLETIEAMIDSGRLPHGFVIHGETGLGKKNYSKIYCQNAPVRKASEQTMRKMPVLY